MSGLYLHIPFCHSKCAYCDFFSTPSNRQLIPEYVEALQKEYIARSHELGDSQVTTIYLGGGTPSAIGKRYLDEIFRWLPTVHVTECTIEVNPEDINEDFCHWLGTTPVNRVSMGIQSLNDRELEIIGRRHSAADALGAYHLLRQSGIKNISVDLIFGLPGQTVESWNKTLESIIALKPDHISAYTLMLEPGTRLWAMARSGKFKETADSDIEQMYRMLCSRTTQSGYIHYEISNYALPGYESVHNSAYWDLTPYLGIGPGAHSFDGKMRRYNPPSLIQYINSPESVTINDEETLTEQINDYIMIQLRTARGLSLEALASRYGQATTDEVMTAARRHITNNNLVQEKDRIRIPEHKLLISDIIISDIML